jgi:hypothetical protein
MDGIGTVLMLTKACLPLVIESKIGKQKMDKKGLN